MLVVFRAARDTTIPDAPGEPPNQAQIGAQGRPPDYPGSAQWLLAATCRGRAWQGVRCGIIGPRAVVSRVEGGPAQIERILGSEFFDGIEADQREAIRNRGLPEGHLSADQLRAEAASRGRKAELPTGGLRQTEIRAWMASKAWAADLRAQFEERGYTFDPATVQMQAFGGDWCYCAGSFPIGIGRALGLSNPIERRFDLINPSEGPMLMKSKLVDQNLPMPESIRLFIWEYTDSEGPRYVAQFWEGLRGIMDRPHTVSVEFPADTVREVNLWGMGLERSLGIDDTNVGGPLKLNAGSGGHTPIRSSIVMTENDLSVDDFRSALLAGQVAEVAPAG